MSVPAETTIIPSKVGITDAAECYSGAESVRVMLHGTSLGIFCPVTYIDIIK